MRNRIKLDGREHGARLIRQPSKVEMVGVPRVGTASAASNGRSVQTLACSASASTGWPFSSRPAITSSSFIRRSADPGWRGHRQRRPRSGRLPWARGTGASGDEQRGRCVRVPDLTGSGVGEQISRPRWGRLTLITRKTNTSVNEHFPPSRAEVLKSRFVATRRRTRASSPWANGRVH